MKNKIENITKAQKIELYDILYPNSLEDDDDIKANDIDELLSENDNILVYWSGLKKVIKWINDNNILI